MAEQNVIEPVCSLLKHRDVSIIFNVLNVLNNILNMSNNELVVKTRIELCKGLQRIQALETHSTETIRNLSSNILILCDCVL